MSRVMNDAEKGIWKIFEPYPKYFWIYLEKMFFVFLEVSAFDVELMTVSLYIIYIYIYIYIYLTKANSMVYIYLITNGTAGKLPCRNFFAWMYVDGKLFRINVCLIFVFLLWYKETRSIKTIRVQLQVMNILI